MQIRKLRLRSKKAYDQDSKNQSCSRPGCTDKKGCYKYRQSKYMEKKFLYTQLHCPQDRDDSDAENPLAPKKKVKSTKLTEGTVYEIGGITVKFLSKSK